MSFVSALGKVRQAADKARDLISEGGTMRQYFFAGGAWAALALSMAPSTRADSPQSVSEPSYYGGSFNQGLNEITSSGKSGYALASDSSALETSSNTASSEAASAAGSCDCNDACDCLDECECCSFCPTWTVKAGAVIMTRAQPHPAVLVEDTVTGDPIFNASDFTFNWAGGLDISIMRHFNECNALEVRYFGIDGWNARSTFTTSAIWNFPTNPPLFGLGVADIDAVYGSTLDSTEVNFRHRVNNRFAWLVGFRWVELGEQLIFNADFGGNDAVIDWDTNNHLYGAQLGADVRVWEGSALSIDSVFKAGIFGNAADNQFGVAQAIGPAFGTYESQGQVAFVGEIGLTGVYQWTEHVAVRGGYQVLWVEGVAVASEQVAATNVIDANGIDTLGGVFYHGALVSVDLTW